MKHWCAWGLIPNQCWLKANHPLFPRKKAENKVPTTMGKEQRDQKENQKGACQQPRLFFVSRPHQWKCLFFSYESFLHNLYFFFKLQSDEQEMPTFSLAGEPLLCSFCFLGVGPPSWRRVQREQANTCRPKPWDYFSSTCRAGWRICCICASKIQPTLVVLLSWQTVHSELDPLYVMAKFDSRAQF